jgi:bifunctional ADP-heptose synthase (sugar kinase/adenylyltransferase)
MKTPAMALERVRELLDGMRDRPVLVLGDLMLDLYLTGKVERISPEGPVPVVAIQSQSSRLGGAANVALNVKVLGATPRLVGWPAPMRPPPS